jgi:hypothetical protein
MSANSRDDHFFIYPRYEDNTSTGHTYCVILRNGRMYEGSALCSKKDNFQKSLGRALAFERALLAYEKDCDNRKEQAINLYNPYLDKV